MKKWMISGSVLAMVLAASGCGRQVTFEEARGIALEDAGVAENEAVFTKEKQEKNEYEFEFQTDENIFSYEISASGKIESKEKELRLQTQAAADTQAPAESPEAVPSGAEKADTAGTANEAAAEAPAEETGAATSSEKGSEALPSAAEGEADGTLTESTQIPTPTKAQKNNGIAGDIGEEKAKQIALEKAGLEESQVQRMKVEKDREDGVLVYEVEFEQGRTEYSYEIVAATGEIVKAETEIDDH